MPTALVRVVRLGSILGALALAVLSCQAVTRSFGSGGSGGAATSTTGTTSTSSSQGSGGTGGTGSTTSTTSGAGGDSGAPDGPVTCDGGLMACEGHCVDIATASTDCGACGHDCGGGACSLGQCQPMVVFSGSVPIGPIAVSTTEVFFATNDDTNQMCKLLACPDTGCVLAPRQLALMEYDINAISWVSDPTTPTVVFLSAPTQNTERPAIFPCPETGCPGSLTIAIEDGLGGFQGSLPVFGNQVYYSSQNFGLGSLTCMAGTCTMNGNLSVKGADVFTAGQNYEYYIDEYIANSTHLGYLYRCAVGVMPCAPVTLLAQDLAAAVGMQVQGGVLYWMIPGASGTQNGAIQTCAAPGCTNLGFLVKGLSTPSDLVVDKDGAYWVTSMPASVQRCVGAVCAGGAQTLSVTATAPHDIATDAGFVYWADGNAIYRVAK